MILPDSLLSDFARIDNTIVKDEMHHLPEDAMAQVMYLQ